MASRTRFDFPPRGIDSQVYGKAVRKQIDSGSGADAAGKSPGGKGRVRFADDPTSEAV